MTRKLTFKVDRSFGSMTVRAGATVDVPAFWAEKCLADGSAIEAPADVVKPPAKAAKKKPNAEPR